MLPLGVFMRRALVLAALLALAPAAALAQERGRLFIAPWGEPVRGVEGEGPLQIWFRNADANHDAALSLEEFLTPADRFFGILDRNKDERVTAMESTALFRATAPDMFAPAAQARARAIRRPDISGSALRPEHERNRREPETPSGAARFALTGEIEPVMSCDGDVSRWVTREEFAACVTRRFRHLDANGDGAFALAESPRAAELIEAVDD
jgi:hypothetical protein